MVLNGDHPLTTGSFVAGLVAAHRASGARATLTAQTFDPGHYGRIVRDENGRLAGIVEYRDATPEQRAIAETNVGAYVFAADALRGALPRLRSDNDQGGVLPHRRHRAAAGRRRRGRGAPAPKTAA